MPRVLLNHMAFTSSEASGKSPGAQAGHVAWGPDNGGF